MYLALDNLPERRQAAYRALFQVHIDNKTLEDIRQATQKGWALGNDQFKEEIGQLLKRRACPLPRGGDHRSVAFREGEG